MTRDKLEYFRQMMGSGMITRDEFKEIENIYHNQDRSFIEIDGKKEVISKERIRRHEHDPYSAALKKGGERAEEIESGENDLEMMKSTRDLLRGLSLQGLLTKFLGIEEILMEQKNKKK
ncbi:MAG: hypothetical protein GX260_00805 [Tissierellia bacterium]|nr:hypothetical protein [Bacillota bacterium]NLL22307.1 hypothetical protein [Tissierellia bacterium]